MICAGWFFQPVEELLEGPDRPTASPSEWKKTWDRWAKRLQFKGNVDKNPNRTQQFKKMVIQAIWRDVFPHDTIVYRHSCFNSYLYRIARASAPGCDDCGVPREENHEEGDAEHTLMLCEGFDHDRDRLTMKIGYFNTNNLVSVMLESPTAWTACRWVRRGGYDSKRDYWTRTAT